MIDIQGRGRPSGRPRRLFGGIGIAVLALLGVTRAGAQVVEKRLPSPARADTSRVPQRTGTIAGAVADSNLIPLEGAEVSILRTNVRVRTLANGKFQILKVPAGEYLVIARRLGFRPVTSIIAVPAGDTARLSYTLERVSQLDSVVITERRTSLRMAEFEYRRRLGQGEFMTQDDISKRASIFAPDLFRSFKTIDVSPVNGSQHGGFPEYIAMGKRGSATITGQGSGACPMSVFVDGVSMPFPFDLSFLPAPRDLAGIEVYAGAATAPMQFGGSSGRSCGVILIWTRDQ